jgi:valyl-tRNA synthetase
MTEAAGSYAGLTREEARIRVVADLQALGLVEKIESYTHEVGHCSRTGTVIEPLLSEQWFVNMKELARPCRRSHSQRARQVLARAPRRDFARMAGQHPRLVHLAPAVVGPPHPVYYGPNGEVKVSLEPITEPGWKQDEDVLDTWFSSALWPFAVLGWPGALEREWYPTSVLITGRDILNLWVSRMILTSVQFVDGEIPFREVFIHPTIQDTFGRRMSKSLGTGIDPMELIDTVRGGRHALRPAAARQRHAGFALSGSGAGAAGRRLRARLEIERTAAAAVGCQTDRALPADAAGAQLRQQDLERRALCADAKPGH